MCLAKDNDVIQALAADRPDQPFGKAILPRRGWCGRLVPNTQGTQTACDDDAISAIPIPVGTKNSSSGVVVMKSA